MSKIINWHHAVDALHGLSCNACVKTVHAKHNVPYEILDSYKYTDLDSAFSNNLLQAELYTKYNADASYMSYLGAAAFTNQNINVLEVGAHFGNNEYDTTVGRQIGKLHNITQSQNTLLSNAIACAARVDNTTELLGQTSYGNGVEFFEDCHYKTLQNDYPNIRVADQACAGGHTIQGSNGLNRITSVSHLKWAKRMQVGDKLYIWLGDNITSEKEYRIITEIIDDATVEVDSPFSITDDRYYWSDTMAIYQTNGYVPYVKLGTCTVDSNRNIIVTTGTEYIQYLTPGSQCQIRLSQYEHQPKENVSGAPQFHGFVIQSITDNVLTINTNCPYPDGSSVTIGMIGEIWVKDIEYYESTLSLGLLTEPAGQAQSWATPIIMSKLRCIKHLTDRSWEDVRLAARWVAEKSGKTEYSFNWDPYRGFGKINVEATVNYLNESSSPIPPVITEELPKKITPIKQVLSCFRCA